MQRVKRFWYVFAVVVLALSLLLGFRVSRLLLSSHPSDSTRPRSSTIDVLLWQKRSGSHEIPVPPENKNILLLRSNLLNSPQ